MTHVLSAIAPIFLIIALGVLLRARGKLPDEFWRGIEKLTFSALFPSLLFLKIADAHIDWAAALPLVGAILIGFHLTAALTVPLRRPLGLGAEAFVAVFQGAIRTNAYVGIAVVLGVCGNAAAGPLGVTLLTVAITINYLGVWGHLHWLRRDGRPGSWRGIVVDSSKNPLIQACVLGAAFNVAGIGLPPVVAPTLELLSRAALPLGLIAVGGGLSISAVRGSYLPVAASTIYKLALLPLLVWGLGVAFGLDGMTLVVAVIFAAVPTSSTAYVVSRQMGSDADLMAAIVTATHFVGIFSLPLIIAVMG